MKRLEVFKGLSSTLKKGHELFLNLRIYSTVLQPFPSVLPGLLLTLSPRWFKVSFAARQMVHCGST